MAFSLYFCCMTLDNLGKGWKDSDTFTFWLPAKAVKIAKGSDPEGKPVRWIQGIASTSHSDLQGEVVVQDGIDFSYFLKHGYFNNDHKPGFENKVGEPTECKITKNGLWVKGFLYNDHKIADQIWELMQAQEANPLSKRKIGFSIEGKVKRRNGRKIEECWIQDIAITPAPVNTATWAEIAKSLSSQEWATKDKDYEEEEKALTTTSGSAVIPESLEGKPARDLDKSLTFEEAVDYVSKSTGLSRKDSANIVNFIMNARSNYND